MSDSGERELVLGNKQLLAIFFTGVLLCGVFFAVGYVVGGNSAKSLSAAGAADVAPSTSTPISEGKREEPQPAADNFTPAVSTPTRSDSGGGLPAAEPRMADNPAAAGSQPPAAPVAAAPIPAQAYQSQPQVRNAATPPEAAPATGVFVSVPEKGAAYVQVSAIARPHSDEVVKSLREARMPAILAESSKPDLYRVLVGPYRAPLALAEAKRKLTDLGFNQLIVVKP